MIAQGTSTIVHDDDDDSDFLHQNLFSCYKWFTIVFEMFFVCGKRVIGEAALRSTVRPRDCSARFLFFRQFST